MKKLIALLIFIMLILAAFVLKVSVVAQVNIDGQDFLPLNNHSYVFSLKPRSDFNSIAIRFLTFNKPTTKIELLLKDSSNQQVLVKEAIQRSLGHGDFYKFSFATLKGKKDYLLQIKGQWGSPYKLFYKKNGDLVYKLYNSKPIAYVALKASQRAAFDWFRLGPLYLMSILIYLGLVAFLLTHLIWSIASESKSA